MHVHANAYALVWEHMFVHVKVHVHMWMLGHGCKCMAWCWLACLLTCSLFLTLIWLLLNEELDRLKSAPKVAAGGCATASAYIPLVQARGMANVMAHPGR